MSTKVKLFAGLIIAVSVILAVLSVWDEPLIVDEVPLVGSGFPSLKKGVYQLNPGHPPLAKDLGTFPLLFLDLDQSAFEGKPWVSDLNGQWEFGRNLVYESGNDAQLIAHAVKIPMLLFFVLSAILIFKWGRKLYGNRGAFIALILFSFSPTVMAHSRFVTTDLTALFGVLFSTYFFLKYLKESSRKNFWFAAIFFGIALLCKFSTILLVFYFLILAFVYALANGRKLLVACRLSLVTALLMAIGFIIVVWPVYYLHTMNYPVEKQYSDTKTLLESYGNRYFADPVVWASDKPVLRAAAQYGLGLLISTQPSLFVNTTYFLGEVSRTGWHYYFPIVYFIKEPLAWWGLVVIALIYASIKFKLPKRNANLQIRSNAANKESLPTTHYPLPTSFIEFAMLLWLMIYWGTSINSTLNIGVRHLLPVFPFTILLVSGQMARLANKKQGPSEQVGKKKTWSLVSLSLVAILGWYVYENLHIFPYYLAYFNQSVGGASQGYKYVVDSNLDWGQDLVRFSDWVKENNIPKIEFDYFGWADPYYYMGATYERLYHDKYLNADDFVAHNRSNGWMAISATFLKGSEGSPDQYNDINYLWLNSFQPVIVIGHSIFVYHIFK